MFFLFSLQAADPQLVIHWKSSTDASATDLIKDRNGNLLDRGLPANGDGYVVTLGYFKEATVSGTDAELFKGDWVPLTSGTAVGDSSSGYGYGNGMFSFTTVFTVGTDVVLVYPYEPAGYEVKTPEVVTSSLPPTGHPIAIRFYDRDVADVSAKYNTVSHRDWKWPTISSGIPQNLYLKASSGTKPPSSKWLYGSIFEDPANPFKTMLGTLATLTVTASTGGTVTNVDGTYNYGQVVTITATPNQHKEFVKWEGDGVAEPTFQSTTVLMTNPRTLQAVFRDTHYDLTLSTTGGGTLAGAGAFPHGSTPTITATPSSGYDFLGWQGTSGAAQGLNNPNLASTSLQSLDRDRAYIAVFQPKQYVPEQIDVNATAGGNFELQTGPYAHFSQYYLKAIPWRGHSFTGWTSDSNSTSDLSGSQDANATLTVSGPAKFTANFLENSYKLTVTSGKGGSATPTNDGPYLYTSQMAVQATPSTGYLFSHWSGDISALTNSFAASTDANMSAKASDVSLQANFSPIQYTVEANSTENGAVSLAAGPYEHFGVYSISSNPSAGFVFTGWHGDASSLQSLLDPNAASTHLIVTGPIDLTATFGLGSFTLGISAGEGGTASGGGTFRSDETPSISATPGAGYRFSHWSVDIDSINDIAAASTTVNMSKLGRNLNLKANFALKTYAVSATVSGNGDVNGTKSFTRTHSHFEQAKLVAQPSAGWGFSQWTWSGSATIAEPANPIASFVVGGETTLVANFVKNSYTLSLGQSNNGDANGSGTFLFDNNITVTASPKDGYSFTEWTGDISTLSNARSPMAVVRIPAKNISLTPSFDPVGLKATVVAGGKGTVSGGGSFQYGTSVTVTATPGSADTDGPRGYYLKEWNWSSSKGSGATTENPYTFGIDSNVTLTAKFVAIPPATFNLDIVKSPSAGGSFLGSGPVVQNVDHTISATPAKDYTFLGWSSKDNLSFLPDDGHPEVTVNLDGNSSVTAHFGANVRKLGVSSEAGGNVSGGGSSFSHGQRVVLAAFPEDSKELDRWIIDKKVSYQVTLGGKAHAPSKPAFMMDGRERPELNLIRGFTYDFEVNTPNFPFYLSTKPEASASYEGEYLNGITGSRTNSGTLTFVVPADAPSVLYYHSPNTKSMGSPLRILSMSDEEILPNPTEAISGLNLNVDLNIRATYKLKKHSLTISSTAGGSLSESTTQKSGTVYDHGSSVSIQANPPESEHYEFSGWQGIGVADPTALGTTVLLTDSREVTATYGPKKYRLTLDKKPAHAGDARTEGNELDFAYGTTVTLIATPWPGSTFTHWTGDAVADPLASTTTLLMNGDKAVAANFQAGIYLLNLSQITRRTDGTLYANPNTGGVIISGNSYSYGSRATIRAIPYPGYKFVEWLKNKTIDLDVAVSTAIVQEGSYQIKGQERPGLVLVRGNTYNFNLDGSTTLGKKLHFSVTADGLNGGGELFTSGVSGDPADSGSISIGITESTPALLYYASVGHPGYGNEIQILNSDASAAGIFDSKSPTTGVEMIADKSLTAVFSRKDHTIDYSAIPSAGGAVNFAGNNPAEHNSSVTLTAVPNPGFRFESWSGDGLFPDQRTNPILSFAATEERRIVARFVQQGEINLTIRLSPEDAGWTTGAGRFGYNPAHPIMASPGLGYKFIGWSGDDILDKKATSTTVHLASDRIITALFEKVDTPQFALVLSVAPAEGGRTDGSGLFEANSQQAISAIPNAGYRFIGWQGEGLSDAQAQQTSIFLNSNKTLVATFERIAAATPDGNGTKTPDLLADALKNFDPVVYLANNPDLKSSLGNNPSEALNHFVNQGFAEGRAFEYTDSAEEANGSKPATPPDNQPKTLGEAQKVFDPVTYLKLNPDLASFFGSDLSGAKDHFFEHGFEAERPFVPITFDDNRTPTPAHGFQSLDHALEAFDSSTYLSFNPEVASVLGSSNLEGARAHFILYGYEQGLQFSTTSAAKTAQPDPSKPSLEEALKHFDPVSYLKLNPSIHSAFGNDLQAAEEHFVLSDFSLGDQSQDSSSEEYTGKLPAEVTLDDAMEKFDPAVYLSNNPDLASLLGRDPHAAEQHFVSYGFNQGREFRDIDQNKSAADSIAGRTLSESLEKFEPEMYLALNPSLSSSIGTKPDDLKEHYVRWGHDLGRPIQPQDIATETGAETTPGSQSGLSSLTLRVFPEGSGSVNGGGTFGKGSTRPIEASANEGYVFLEWQGKDILDSSSAKTTVDLASHLEVYAIFRYIGTGNELPSARIPGATYIGWDWWNNQWFGTYWHQAENQWVHHETLGWIFLVPYSEQSVWIWMDYLGGWHWTSKEVYPFLYSEESSSWLWFFNSEPTKQLRMFFRYSPDQSSGSWERR